MVKFLIDECLSLDLVAVARGRGFVESSHVVWMGKAGWKDWELKPFILEGDWTLVTRNSVDFRGHAENPGPLGNLRMFRSTRDSSVSMDRMDECGGPMRVVRGCS